MWGEETSDFNLQCLSGLTKGKNGSIIKTWKSFSDNDSYTIRKNIKKLIIIPTIKNKKTTKRNQTNEDAIENRKVCVSVLSVFPVLILVAGCHTVVQ